MGNIDLLYNKFNILYGDCLDMLKTIPDNYVQTCITSPPYYGLRDYGVEGQIGLEETPLEYIQKLVNVFHEVKRVLKSDGTLWVNIGDTYATNTPHNHNFDDDGGRLGNHSTLCVRNVISEESKIKAKDLVGVPWMLAFALRDDGWYLRQDIIWNKPNSMPDPVTDRFVKSHEYIYLLSKSAKYLFNVKSVSIDKKYVNKKDVWNVSVRPYKLAHFATFPTKLIEPCILTGSNENDIVLDIFSGSGTTGEVALLNKRKYIGIELNKDYVDISMTRLLPIVKQRNLF